MWRTPRLSLLIVLLTVATGSLPAAPAQSAITPSEQLVVINEVAWGGTAASGARPVSGASAGRRQRPYARRAKVRSRAARNVNAK